MIAEPGHPTPAQDANEARQQIQSAVDHLLAPEPSQVLTDAELGCLSASVLDNLTDERVLELAPDMTLAEVADGVPSSLLTEGEVDLIIDTALGCVDWPTVLNGAFFAVDGITPIGPPECFVVAAESQQFAADAARITLFDSDDLLEDLIALVGEDCIVDVASAQVVEAMTAEGVSQESAQCVAERTVELLFTAAEVESGGTDEEDGFLMLGMMFAIFSCLTDEEMEALMGAEMLAEENWG